MNKQPLLLDLFSGAGGISHGFRQAGYKIGMGIDSFEPAAQTFKRNFPEAHSLFADVREINANDITSLLGRSPDIIVGGPSCQGFSTAGGLSKSRGRDPYDPRNSLFIEYVRLVEEIQPQWLVFENVPGLLLYHKGAVARQIIRMFEEIGFRVQPLILLAADYGVPQLRRRLIFVGTRTKMPIMFPAPTHGDPMLWKSYSLPFAYLSRFGHKTSASSAPQITFDQACGDLPALKEGESIDGEQYPTCPLTDYQELMRRESPRLNQHTAFKLSENDRLAAKVLKPGENWRAIPLELLPARFAKIRPYDATTMLRRLRGDEPAYTITTKFNEATTGSFIHPRDNRTLSIREAARLQSFPDHFIFEGSGPQIRQQIGNAVPPLLAQALGEALFPSVVLSAMGTIVPSLRLTMNLEEAERDPIRLATARRTTKGSGLAKSDPAPMTASSATRVPE